MLERKTAFWDHLHHKLAIFDRQIIVMECRRVLTGVFGQLGFAKCHVGRNGTSQAKETFERPGGRVPVQFRTTVGVGQNGQRKVTLKIYRMICPEEDKTALSTKKSWWKM
jgi:hypothetical protein